MGTPCLLGMVVKPVAQCQCVLIEQRREGNGMVLACVEGGASPILSSVCPFGRILIN
jgi:hypothetical protein